ncbi:hypothetical protein AusDCA_3063 [Desulfitobacterium sp. AusDCA]
MFSLYLLGKYKNTLGKAKGSVFEPVKGVAYYSKSLSFEITWKILHFRYKTHNNVNDNDRRLYSQSEDVCVRLPGMVYWDL